MLEGGGGALPMYVEKDDSKYLWFTRGYLFLKLNRILFRNH